MGIWDTLSDFGNRLNNEWQSYQLDRELNKLNELAEQLDKEATIALQKQAIAEYNLNYLEEVFKMRTVEIEEVGSKGEPISELETQDSAVVDVGEEKKEKSLGEMLLGGITELGLEYGERVSSNKSIALSIATATRLLLKAEDEDLLRLIRGNRVSTKNFNRRLSHKPLATLNEKHSADLDKHAVEFLDKVSIEASKQVKTFKEEVEDPGILSFIFNRDKAGDWLVSLVKDSFDTWSNQEGIAADKALQFRYGTLNQSSTDAIVFEFLGKQEVEQENNAILDVVYHATGVHASRKSALADKIVEESQYDMASAQQYLAFSNKRTNLLLEELNKQRSAVHQDFLEFSRLAKDLVEKMGENDIQSMTVNLPNSEFKANLMRSSSGKVMDDWLRKGAIAVSALIPGASYFYSKYADEALGKAEDIRADTGIALDKIGEVIVALCKTNRYVVDTYLETARLYDVFQSYFEELKKMNQFIEEGGDMDEIEEETLLVISNGYQLSAILTDIVCTPVFKVQEDDSALPEIEEEKLNLVLSQGTQIPSLPEAESA